MVEHTAHNGLVVGSNPTKLKLYETFIKRISKKKIKKKFN